VLSGVKVIDLTAARSGPTSVRVLADLGADVIQVVRPATIPETDVPAFDRENRNDRRRGAGA
jgi:crotonobetainyl-CoA:carnitine CoA-transferase CaiB-like acyl-CoA transferase